MHIHIHVHIHIHTRIFRSRVCGHRAAGGSFRKAGRTLHLHVLGWCIQEVSYYAAYGGGRSGPQIETQGQIGDRGHASRYQKIERNKTEIQFCINNIKNAIEDYNKTSNEQFVIDALNVYINKLEPLTKENMHLKYKENFILYDKKDNTYSLIQNKCGIKDIEFSTVESIVVSNEL
jgi:hypothetical protein